jgi:hypothetical protein
MEGVRAVGTILLPGRKEDKTGRFTVSMPCAKKKNRTGSQVKPAGLPGLEIFKLGLEVETGRFYARPGPVLLTVVCHALPLSGQKYKPIDPSLREPTTGRGRGRARREMSWAYVSHLVPWCA